MKATLRILLFGMGYLICLSPSFGQGKFSLSASVTPYYQYINTKSSLLLPDLSGGPAVAVDATYRQNGQGYSVGLMARYALTTNWSVSSGILYNYTTYKAPTITTTPDFTTVNTPPFVGGLSRKHNYRIPLLINYQSSTKRLSPYFSAGATVDFRDTNFLDVGTGNEALVKGGKAVLINPFVGVGGIYQLNDHLSLLAQPSFTYLLLDRNEAIISANNYLLGLQVQLMYSF